MKTFAEVDKEIWKATFNYEMHHGKRPNRLGLGALERRVILQNLPNYVTSKCGMGSWFDTYSGMKVVYVTAESHVSCDYVEERPLWGDSVLNLGSERQKNGLCSLLRDGFSKFHFSKQNKEQQMNEEMVKRCQNDLRQAWGALSREVRDAMEGKPVQVLDDANVWRDYSWARIAMLSTGRGIKVPASIVIRLAPSVKADPVYDVRNASMDVHNGQKFWGCVMPGPRSPVSMTCPAFFFPMHEVASMANFAGIRYENDLMWHPYVRCDLGNPLKVRFLKP